MLRSKTIVNIKFSALKFHPSKTNKIMFVVKQSELIYFQFKIL
jgi:hypothetical protein